MGIMDNTYLDQLGAQREKYPPVGWDDSPYKLTMSPNILNDPAFSEYDLSNIRTYDQDPRLRDAITLGDRKSELDTRWQQHGSAGYTYMPNSPYDPNKVYIGDLDKLKMAVGPGAEQTKQGNINKQIATTIAHEYRHNMFADPKYEGIIDAAHDRFGGWDSNISRYDLEEYINRAADIQLDPENWKQSTLDAYEDEYNEMLTDPESWIRNQERIGKHVPNWKKKELLARKMPAHLTRMNTTKKFNQAARDFFEKVRREKLKRPTQTNIQKRAIGMPEHLTPPPKRTYVPPARPHGNGGGDQKGSMPTRTAGKNPWGRADGGLINFYRYGGFVG